MGKNVDSTLMQMRMINTRKGPAVQALRAQTDRNFISEEWNMVVETTSNLFLKEGVVTDLLVKNNRIMESLLVKQRLRLKQ